MLTLTPSAIIVALVMLSCSWFRNQRLFHRLAQQFNLHGVEVGDAKMAHLARAFQLIEGLCHFLRLHQRIRTMQQQHVQIIGAQPLQNAVLWPLGYAPWKNQTCLCGCRTWIAGHYLYHARRRSSESHRQKSLRISVAIDVGMVKENWRPKSIEAWTKLSASFALSPLIRIQPTAITRHMQHAVPSCMVRIIKTPRSIWMNWRCKRM